MRNLKRNKFDDNDRPVNDNSKINSPETHQIGIDSKNIHKGNGK